MSSHLRKSRRQQSHSHDHGGAVIGLGEEGAVEELKKATHDTLIQLMGPARTGGVEWRVCDPSQARAALDVVAEGQRARYSGYYAHLDEFPDSWVVVAFAPGLPGWADA